MSELDRLLPTLCFGATLGFLGCQPVPPSDPDPVPGPTPVADRLTEAQSSDGRFISWREHILDDSEIGGVELSGSDGLVLADLDGDGLSDVVSVHESDTTYDGVADGHIRIAFATGDVDRWERVTLAEGAEAGAAEDVAVADLNGDGHPDIVAACELAHLIYFQNPGPPVRSQVWPRVIPKVTTGRGSFIRVFLGDFDGDGRPEAVAPNKGAQSPTRGTTEKNPVSIFAVKGDPLDSASWREHELGRYVIPQNSQPVDLDGDGDLDIVVGSRGEGRILWFENLGGPGFNFAEHEIDLGATQAGGFNLAYADLNRDGRLDIVAAVPQGLAWLEQPGAASSPWTVHPMGTFLPDSVTGFTLADIDGDGDLDVMAGSYSRGPRDRDGEGITAADPLGRLGWFAQPTDPTQEWIRHDISRRKRGMFDQFVAKDMDGDGDLDFVSTRGNSDPYDGVFWLEQVRSDEARPSFEGARQNDSQEMPLPLP